MTFEQLVHKYQKQEQQRVQDAIVAGLSVADEVAVHFGVLEDAGLMNEALDTVGNILPFAVVAVTEGGRVLFQKKKWQDGLQDAAWRSAKAGAAMGAGYAALQFVPGMAVPIAVGTRLALDGYRLRFQLAERVKDRHERVKKLIRT